MKKWIYMTPFLLTALIGPHLAKETYLAWLFQNCWWLVIMFLVGWSMVTHPEMYKN